MSGASRPDIRDACFRWSRGSSMSYDIEGWDALCTEIGDSADQWLEVIEEQISEAIDYAVSDVDCARSASCGAENWWPAVATSRDGLSTIRPQAPCCSLRGTYTRADSERTREGVFALHALRCYHEC